MLERVIQKAIEQQNKHDAASQGSSNNKTVMSDLNGEEPAQADIDNADKYNKDDLAFLDKLVISRDSKWKGKFDLMMMLASIFNVFSNAYYSAFGEPQDQNS